MGNNRNTGSVNWRDETSWALIAALSGLVLAVLFDRFERFPGAHLAVLVGLCCAGFYVLSLLLRLQNRRGEFWLGRGIVRENRLKWAFPLAGFTVGLALLFL